MPPKYLNVKEAAQAIGVSEDEVKQMLERRELHGYRDGADWKFKIEDVDRVAKQHAADTGVAGGDEGDVLLSEHALGRSDAGASGTVIGMEPGKKPSPDSDIQLAGSDVNVAARPKPKATAKPASKEKAAGDTKTGQFEELDLTLDQDLTLEDSNVASAAVGAPSGGSAVDLGGKRPTEDEQVLGGSGTGSDISIGGDSGISLVDPADSGLSLEEPLNLGAGGEESLELGEDDMLSFSASTSSPSVKTDDDFQLTPMPESEADESESGSQVIALDTEGEGDEGVTMIAGGGGGGMAAMLDEDLSAGATPGFMAVPVGDMALGQPGGLPAGVVMQPAYSLPESPYTFVNVAFLVVCAVMLTLAGILVVDLVEHQRTFATSHFVSGSLLDSILGLFERP